MGNRIRKALLVGTMLMAAVGCTATRTQESPGEVIDDSVLTAKVKTALIEDPVTKAGQINVETYRGVVQLGGFVDNSQQKERATTVARSVGGVKEVRNDLRVGTGQETVGKAIDDSAVTASVKARLVEDKAENVTKINVETKNGIVQLTGFVDSNEDKTRAAQLAREVDGVRDVRNDLEIRQR